MKNTGIKMTTNCSRLKKFFFTLLFLLSSTALPALAQEYDPLLDPLCKVIQKPEKETWNTAYMWHPGQLAAWLQLRQKTESKARCTFVDYPGNFYAYSEVTYFRGKIKSTGTLRWNAPGTVKATIDKKEQKLNARQATVKPGTHQVAFQVNTKGQLPALILEGADVDLFEASTDGVNWHPVESDARFCHPEVFPDDAQEIQVSIPVRETLLLRNARREGDKFILGPQGNIILDFCHIEMGHLQLTATGKGKVFFQVGESLEEVTNPDTKVMEQLPLEPVALERKKEINLTERAVRFVRISTDRGCTLENVRFLADVWPVEMQMQFECDDAQVNRLWKAGVATLHTALHNFYLDGIKRDYLPWAMDAVLNSLGGDYAFGEPQVSRNGISVALMPENPTAEDLGVVDYPLHALIGLRQEYLRYGNLQTSRMYKNRILSQLDLYESLQDEHGFISAKAPTWGFIPGWSKDNGPETFGTAAYPQMMLMENFRIAAYFCRLWKENRLAAHYEAKARELRESILQHFWDAERRVFINGYREDGSRDERISYHSQYWAVLTDLYPAAHYDYLYSEIIPNIPAYKDNISYEKGYECLAYVKAGKTAQLLDLLNETFGYWLDEGNTRFPENFRVNDAWEKQLEFYGRPFGLSLCHGANGVPSVVLALRGIMGFSQSQARPNEYFLHPNLLHLNHVKGRIPVKEGFITVDFQKNGEARVTAPKGAKVTLIWNGETKKIS